jgi:hypothetical protein
MRKLREEANVSDGPRVEHSIMKRAWPYALALAVVVTGCYLALVPLLRSLNPGPTATQSQALSGSGTTTVSSSKTIVLVGTSHSHGFTALDPTAKKTVKKAAKKSSKRNSPPVSTTTHEFVTPTQPTTSSSTVSSSSSSSTSTPPAKTTPTKTTPKTTAASNRARAQVGGTIDQADNGGFAGKGNGESTMAGGKSSTLAPGN